MKKKLLIVGGSGFLGGYLADLAACEWDTFVSFYTTPVKNKCYKTISLDIRSKKDVEKTLFNISPQVIINTAAVSDICKCETNGNLAWDVNFAGLKNISNAAKKIGARLIHISTDQVFDGIKGNYSEEDIPKPISKYGKSKLAADNYIELSNPNYFIIRPSPIYGWSLNSSASFIENLLRSLKHGHAYKGFIDEFRNPIYVKVLGAIILKLTTITKSNELFHVCGPERLNRYDFALRVCTAFDFETSLVIPIKSDNHVPMNLRPKDCSMSIAKIQKKIDESISGIAEGLYDMKELSGRSVCTEFYR